MDEVYIVDYDASWPQKFTEEAERIREVFGGPNLLAVEHVGSTAVPGLAAKPIVDILVIVQSLEEAKSAVDAMHTWGCAYWYDNPNPNRLFFVRGLPPDGPRTHHVHVMQPDSDRAGDTLLFRDYLRSHSEARGAYAALKRELAKRHQEDREAYTDAKGAFVNAVVARARGQ